MKLSFATVIFSLLITLQSFSQEIKGKVIDLQNTFELANVQIKSVDGSYSTSTNFSGIFIVPKKGTYIFELSGYESKSIIIDASNKIVELKIIPQKIDEITITSNNFQSKLKTLPTSIATISAKQIEQNNTVNIAPILNNIPGVFMHSGTLCTNRITTRGIGSRNLFGTSKIKIYYQDIPLTNGSGASTIEDIELSTLGRIEILKGPSSSMYGAGLGGTIQLIPNKGMYNEVSSNSGVTFGSFGLQKYLLQSNFGNHKNTARLSYSNLHSDGYRNNNETDRQVLTLATNHFIGDNDKLTIIGNYVDLKAYIPSSLNEDDYKNNPKKAAFTWGRAKGFEDYKKGLFGLTWQHDYNSKTQHKTSVFGSFIDSYEARPFNILKENTYGLGIRTRIIKKTSLFEKSFEWTLGGEFFKDNNSYQTHRNLYNDFPPETGSVEGEKLSDFKEKRSYYNLFFDSKYQISNNTNVTLGINYNYTKYTLKDKFTGNGSDFSGDYNFKAMISPKLGVTHQISRNTMAYITASHGFSPPSLEETLLPDGLINTTIKPESGWNYEFGFRGNLFNDRLYYDGAIYRMDVKNLLVARRTDSDEYIGINAGKTRYNGIELMANYLLFANNKINISLLNATAINDFKFKDFIDDQEDYSGNELTGVPKFTFNSNIDITTTKGLYGSINYNYVGKMPIRDDNTVYSEKYQLTNLKLGYKNGNSKKIQFDIFIGLNNVFDEKYASMLLINAGSFGGNAPRYYYPGEPVNFYSGGNLKYVF